MTNPPEHEGIRFGTIDEDFGHLDLTESQEMQCSRGPRRLLSVPGDYALRLQARTESTSYRPGETAYPLQRSGTKIDINGRVSILGPTISRITTPQPPLSPALGSDVVTDSVRLAVREGEIADMRGLYFVDDHVLVIREGDVTLPFDSFVHVQLWLAWEGWLLQHFPNTRRMYADDDEPGAHGRVMQEFLGPLGYDRVSERLFSRAVT